jgi:hypothetical protein
LPSAFPAPLMGEKERIQEWIRWWKIGPPGYQYNSLVAILRNDGEKMLRSVLKELGLGDSTALLKEMDKRERDSA